DQNRVNLLRQVRNPARERSRNPNREVWESPSVYGGEDVNNNLSKKAQSLGFQLVEASSA
ncbi:MAG: hypothetical protein ACKPH1_27885, partial [Microcystis panniformis]